MVWFIVCVYLLICNFNEFFLSFFFCCSFLIYIWDYSFATMILCFNSFLFDIDIDSVLDLTFFLFLCQSCIYGSVFFIYSFIYLFSFSCKKFIFAFIFSALSRRWYMRLLVLLYSYFYYRGFFTLFLWIQFCGMQKKLHKPLIEINYFQLKIVWAWNNKQTWKHR